MLMYLAETPFGRTGGASAIQLENESEVYLIQMFF